MLNAFEFRIVSSAKPVALLESPPSVRIGNAKNFEIFEKKK